MCVCVLAFISGGEMALVYIVLMRNKVSKSIKKKHRVVKSNGVLLEVVAAEGGGG